MEATRRLPRRLKSACLLLLLLLQKQLELLRLHNISLNVHGQVIRARVLDMDRKKIVIDTGVKVAKIAHSDISSECIIGTTRQDDTPRKPGEIVDTFDVFI